MSEVEARIFVEAVGEDAAMSLARDMVEALNRRFNLGEPSKPSEDPCPIV